MVDARVNIGLTAPRSGNTASEIIQRLSVPWTRRFSATHLVSSVLSLTTHATLHIGSIVLQLDRTLSANLYES